MGQSTISTITRTVLFMVPTTPIHVPHPICIDPPWFRRFLRR